MNVLICLNESYIDFYLVTLYSLMINNDNIVLYIFHTEDLSRDSVERIRKMAGQFSNQVHDINVSINDIVDLPNKEWPVEAWLRHMAISLLPSDMERILYIDGDIIVDDSILSLYNVDMKDYCYVAAMDRPINGKCGIERDEKRLAGLGMSEKDVYVNAGILLINLSKIRALEYKQEDFWEFARAHISSLSFPDQDLLNGMFAGKILVCDDDIYNCQINTYSFEEAKKLLENARIIHYTSFRPWTAGYKRIRAGMKWWQYAIRVDSKFIWKYVVWGIVTLCIVMPWHIARIAKNTIMKKIEK